MVFSALTISDGSTGVLCDASMASDEGAEVADDVAWRFLGDEEGEEDAGVEAAGSEASDKRRARPVHGVRCGVHSGSCVRFDWATISSATSSLAGAALAIGALSAGVSATLALEASPAADGAAAPLRLTKKLHAVSNAEMARKGWRT